MSTPFKMKGFSGYGNESPVKQLGVVKKGVQLAIKYGKKAYKAIKGGSTTTTPKKTTSYVKHDPKSGHLRFQTDYTSKGGKTTGYSIPVKGSATGKPGGLKTDPTRTHRLPKGVGWGDVDKIVKGYTGK